MTDNASIHQILENSPAQLEAKLEELLFARRETERVYATNFLRYKHGEGQSYSIEDAKNMALASESYDEAKAKEIKLEAQYRGIYENLVNARKRADLIARGL